MHNKNFINECVEGRKNLFKNKEFKKFNRGYILSMFIYNTVAFIAIVGAFFGLSEWVPSSDKSQFAVFIGLGLMLSMMIPIYNLPKFLLLLLHIKKAPTEKWLEHIGEDEERAWYGLSNIDNTNLFNLSDLSKLEYKKIRLVFDDNFNSFFYNPNGVLLTDEPIKSVTTDDKSYNDIKSTNIGNRVETKRITKVYTKVIFADGKFITFLNAPTELIKKFEQLMH